MDIGAGQNFTYKVFQGYAGNGDWSDATTYCAGLCSSQCQAALGRYSTSASLFWGLVNAEAVPTAYIGLYNVGSVMTWLDGRTCANAVSDSVCYNLVSFQGKAYGIIDSAQQNVITDTNGGFNYNAAICEFPGKRML
jgi:hypothetical protein